VLNKAHENKQMDQIEMYKKSVLHFAYVSFA